MNGFEIKLKEERISIAMKSGVSTVNISNINGVAELHIAGRDFHACKTQVWRDASAIEIGDEIEIKITVVKNPSEPVWVTESNDIKHPKSKLDMFLALEEDLKKRGLL